MIINDILFVSIMLSPWFHPDIDFVIHATSAHLTNVRCDSSNTKPYKPLSADRKGSKDAVYNPHKYRRSQDQLPVFVRWVSTGQ